MDGYAAISAIRVRVRVGVRVRVRVRGSPGGNSGGVVLSVAPPRDFF